MNVLKGIKKLGTGLLLLFLALFAISPIASFIGIPQPPVQDISAFLQFLLIIGSIVIAVAILAIFGFGYLALTGWKDYKKFSKKIRFWFAFSLGVVIFSLSGPLSVLLPIPFLPIVLTAMFLWGILRTVSHLFLKNEASNLRINDAITTAKDLVIEIEPTAQDMDILDSWLDKNLWKVLLLSKKSQRKYEIQIDNKNGGVTKWRSI
jgi:hypothetical protein